MKFRITFKDPNGVDYNIQEVVSSILGSYFDELDGYELENVVSEKTLDIEEFIQKWVKWKECITIEFDTIAGTATVVESKNA